MRKATITRLFVGSLVALLGGLVLLGIAGGLAYANGSLVMDGPDVVGIDATPFGWAMIVLAAVAVLVMIGAALVQFVAWVGAVLNTAQLENKTWFVVLLLTGLLSFGFIAMLVYVIAGPPDAEPPVSAPSEAPTNPSRVA
jgi:hypothetical protein